MDKKAVNKYLDKAYEAIELSEMLESGKVKKAYRSQISSFGASISMGSVRAAIAFFSKQGGSEVNRPKILYAIYLTLNDVKVDKKVDLEKRMNEASNNLFQGLGKGKYQKDDIVNAAIAVKLAMNLYVLD